MNKDQQQQSGSRNPNEETEQNNKQSNESNVSQDQQLTKEDLPDSTNESQGNTGSGQRQDSN